MNDKQYTISMFIFVMIIYFLIMSALCINTNSILPLIFILPTLILIVFILRIRLNEGVD